MAALPPSSAIGGVAADEHGAFVERRFAGQAAGQAADAADASGRRSARSGGSAAPAPASAVGAGAVPALAAGHVDGYASLASASPPARPAAESQSSRRARSGASHSVSPLAPAASGDASLAAQAARGFLEHNGSADGLLADVQTRRALSVSFRSAAVHIRARSDRLTSKHVHTQPELPRRTLNRTLCITSLVNCGIRTQYGERFESLRCFNGVVSALVNLADIPNAARLRLIYSGREQCDGSNAPSMPWTA